MSFGASTGKNFIGDWFVVRVGNFRGIIYQIAEENNRVYFDLPVELGIKKAFKHKLASYNWME